MVAAAEDLEIGPAGERRPDADAHLAGTDLRNRHALQADVLPAMEHYSPHPAAHGCTMTFSEVADGRDASARASEIRSSGKRSVMSGAT